MIAGEVVIVREYKAPIERVFQAWIDPKLLVQWFHISDVTEVETAEVDLRVGGKYRIVIRDPEDTMVCFGSYTAIDRPNSLEFTWAWEVSSIEPGETLVRVDLAQTGDKTRMTLTHSRFTSDASYKAHDMGWNGVLTSLAKIIEG